LYLCCIIENQDIKNELKDILAIGTVVQTTNYELLSVQDEDSYDRLLISYTGYEQDIITA